MDNIRIIPRLDIKGPNVVKGIFNEGLRIVGSPQELATRCYKAGADEIIYMDIVASLYQRNLDFELLKSVANHIFIPLTVGGGIRSIGDINNALRAGADKVAINTYAVKNPNFIKEAAQKFGSQCIVLSVEAKQKSVDLWEAYIDGGREKTGIDAVAWIKRAIKLGVGEVMVSSIDKDGLRGGFATELCQAVTAFASVPVIVHGGAGKLESVAEVLKLANPDAVAIASAFHYQDYSIKKLKNFLRSKEFPIRQ